METNQNSQRKLAAIMFTDIVGYSKMVEKDEVHTLSLLEEHNNILTAIIAKHDGIIIKHIGDAIFAEFNEIIDCVNAAIKIQTDLKKRNNISRDHKKIVIRVGIHYGKVFEKDNDLTGEKYNFSKIGIVILL